MVLLKAFWAVLFGSVLVFWLLPRRLRMPFLGAVSAGFIAWVAPAAALCLVVWVTAFWLVARPAAQGRTRRRLTLLLIVGVFGQLAWFKYLPPLIAGLSGNSLEAGVVVPLGMSFFTFKLVHYAIEVSRGEVEEHGLAQFWTYMFLFPIFTAGPIERIDHFLAHQEERFSLDSASQGLTRIAVGLIKRFLIGEAILQHALHAAGPSALETLGHMPAGKVWLYLLLSFLFVYMDFSAYSDIGIGASRLFGIGIMENFRFPLLACDISEFWRRWHISLSRWCQSYVYLPVMGYTRSPYLAAYATFLVMGLWHAGTFNRIGWGLYHATGLAVFTSWTLLKRRMGWKKFFRRPLLRYSGWPITTLFVAGSAAFLIAEAEGAGLGAAVRILCRMVAVDLPGSWGALG